MISKDIIRFENVSFRYPNTTKKSLENISFSVKEGEFAVICGASGCGKSTLANHFKKALIPFGECEGDMYFYDKSIKDLDDMQSALRIGVVQQDTDAQTVTDKVYHELAFGLENVAFKNDEIYRRVTEMSEYFGLGKIFRKDVNSISGGERQIVALASVLAMHPDLLVLDEPTAQLDPIAAARFMDMLVRINQEFGTTVVVTEQRLEGIIPLADKIILMEGGRIYDICEPKALASAVARYDKDNNSAYPVYRSLPASIRLYKEVGDMCSVPYGVNDVKDSENAGRRDGRINPTLRRKIYASESAPVNVSEGRRFLKNVVEILRSESENEGAEKKSGGYESKYETEDDVQPLEVKKELPERGKPDFAIKAKDISFSYEKKKKTHEDTYIIKKLEIKIPENSIYAIMGSNGSGKTTLLKLLAGIYKPQKGSIKTTGKVTYLAQNPVSLFTEITVEDELAEIFATYERKEIKLPDAAIIEKVSEMLELLHLTDVRKHNPYDLSGGQKQRLALGKALLTEPDILLLDEPTKGLDAAYKAELARLLQEKQGQGMTVIIVSHDIEFVECVATHAALIFDKEIRVAGDKREFFMENRYYTTSARVLSRGIVQDALNVEEIVERIFE